MPIFLFTEETVVCIHGLFAGPWSMRYIEKEFKKEGYEVINWGYSSLERKIEEHAADLVDELKNIALHNPGRPMKFVAHSLGCLVLRAAMNHSECPEEAKKGRAVLLAPPNQGSCWARYLEQYKVIKKILKEDAGKEVLTAENFKYLGNFPSSLDVLVIAGNWGFNPLIEGENDGTVAVQETYLDTPHEHLVINSGHKTILVSEKAVKLTKSFLEKK